MNHRAILLFLACIVVVFQVGIILAVLDLRTAVSVVETKTKSIIEEDLMVTYEYYFRVQGACIKATVTGQTAAEADQKLQESLGIHPADPTCPYN